jgi:tRNA 2-thiocytidine biosynthesis protein TtcA
VKEMLQGWEKQYPGRLDTMFSAVQNVVPSHLADTELFDFKGLKQSEEAMKRLNVISL